MNFFIKFIEKKLRILRIILISFSLCIITYVIYKSELYYAGQNKDYYLKYYIFSFVTLFFSSLIYFIQKRHQVYSFLSILLLFFFCYSVETFNTASIFFDKYREQNIQQEYAKKNGLVYDKRSKFKFYRDYKKKYSNAALAIDPYHFLKEDNQKILPLSGISKSKTVHCNENGYFSVYESDRYGFNNPDLEWDKNEVEAIIIGDRFVQGDCVNESDTISGNLRKNFNRINKTGVLNLGQGGNGPLMEYASIKEYLPLISSKRVIWVYAESNDLFGRFGTEGLDTELSNKILLKYLNNYNFRQNLNLKQKEIDRKAIKKLNELNKYELSVTSQNKIFKFIKLNNFRRILKELYLGVYSEVRRRDIQKITPEFKKIIYLSKKFSEEQNSKFYFVYIPERSRYFNNRFDENVHDYNKVIEFISSLNIPIINIHSELLKKTKDPLSLFPMKNSKRHYHFNEKGYRLVSNVIFKKILEIEKNLF
jgi:hypothetical protein